MVTNCTTCTYEFSGTYELYVQKKITSHQIIHLLQISLFLGYIGNYDGQYHEMKHKDMGRRSCRLFLGGDISAQIVNHEIVRENIKLARIGPKVNNSQTQVSSSANPVADSIVPDAEERPVVLQEVDSIVGDPGDVPQALSPSSDVTRQWIDTRKLDSKRIEAFDFEGWLGLLNKHWPPSNPPD